MGAALTNRSESLVSRIADGYDDEGGLATSVLDRLQRRVSGAGKTCRVCHKRKLLTAFGPDGRNSDGLDSRCRSCDAARKRAEK